MSLRCDDQDNNYGTSTAGFADLIFQKTIKNGDEHENHTTAPIFSPST